jgi:hypothetical protein
MPWRDHEDEDAEESALWSEWRRLEWHDRWRERLEGQRAGRSLEDVVDWERRVPGWHRRIPDAPGEFGRRSYGWFGDYQWAETVGPNRRYL